MVLLFLAGSILGIIESKQTLDDNLSDTEVVKDIEEFEWDIDRLSTDVVASRYQYIRL